MTDHLSALVKNARALEGRTGLGSGFVKDAAKKELVSYCVTYLAHGAHMYTTDEERTLSRDTQRIFDAISNILDEHLPPGSEDLEKRRRILGLAKSFGELEPTFKDADISERIAALNATEPEVEFSRHDALALIKKLGDLRDHIEEQISTTFPILANRLLDELPASTASQRCRNDRSLPTRRPGVSALSSPLANPSGVTKRPCYKTPSPRRLLSPPPLCRKRRGRAVTILAAAGAHVCVTVPAGDGEASTTKLTVPEGFFATVAMFPVGEGEAKGGLAAKDQRVEEDWQIDESATEADTEEEE